jgi:hypothetical protein
VTSGDGFETITMNAKSARPGGLYRRNCGQAAAARRQARLVTLTDRHFPMLKVAYNKTG